MLLVLSAIPSIFTPVSLWNPVERFNAIEDVPTKRLELPNVPLGIVPLVNLVALNADINDGFE